MKFLIKINIVAAAVAFALTACSGEDGDPGADGVAGEAGEAGRDAYVAGVTPGLTRLATVPNGAEVSGLFLTENGDLFFNAQHPEQDNSETVFTQNVNGGDEVYFDTGTIGVIDGVNFNRLYSNLVSSPVPTTDAERETVQPAVGEYNILVQSGWSYGSEDTGEGESSVNRRSGHIYANDGETLLTESVNPDFNGYIEFDDVTYPATITLNGESQQVLSDGYLYTAWNDHPGGVQRAYIVKFSTGKWRTYKTTSRNDDTVATSMISFSNVSGTATNSSGTISPWKTPLISEEWVVDSSVDSTTDSDWNSQVEIDNNPRLAKMWQLTQPIEPNPYNYGYIIEIINPMGELNSENQPTPVKHFVMGRFEHESVSVMPDERTVYLTQNDTGGVLFKFVADTAADLSSGTLYAAKLSQDLGLSDPIQAGFSVTWIELAQGNNSQIQTWINEYNAIGVEDFEAGRTNFMSVADVEAWAAWVDSGRPVDGSGIATATYPSVENGGSAVTAGQPIDERAVFLESRAAAKALNATAEWRRLKGVAINYDRVREAIEDVDLVADEDVNEAYAYFAVSDIDNTMTDGEGDIQLNDRVKDCGGIYRARIEAGYDIARIEPILMGSTYRETLIESERCDINQISQPDDIVVMENGNILIGEDGLQLNNAVWMYNPKAQ